MTETVITKQDVTYLKELFEIQKSNFLARKKNISIVDRIHKLKKIKNWILLHQKEILEALKTDLGKNEVEASITDIKPVLWEIDLACKKLQKWVKPTKTGFNISFLGTSSKTIYEPLGVVLILAPWNFPFNLAIGPLVSAIAAGNNIFLKPSELSSSTSELIKSMIEELFTEDEITTVLGGPHISEELLKLPFNHIFFTGSPAIGKLVMKAAAENLSSVTLELGGCNPAIVDENTNIKDTAQKIIYGKFLNAGQSCLSINYLFVHHSIQDELIKTLIIELDRMFPLDSNYKRTDFGKIINTKHFNRIKKLFTTSIENGSNNLLSDKPIEDETYFPPALLLNSSLSSLLMHEEIFGPLLPIIPYKNLDEVILFLQTQPSSLASYVFTKSASTYEKVVNETVSGTTCMNETTLHFAHPQLPFGGINNSGMGKSHGYYGFLAFTNQRAVLKQRIGFTVPKLIYPPYTNTVKKISGLIMKYF